MKKTFKTSIVGIKHQVFSLDTISNIKSGQLITLQAEPGNRHDANAVAVYSQGFQIGYIRAVHAAVISPALISGNGSATVKVTVPGDVSPSPEFIQVSVALTITENLPVVPRVSAKKVAGIYKITVQGQNYIGQSSDINKRLAAHWKDFTLGNHGNWHLQRLWSEFGPQAFEVSIISTAPSGLGTYELQEWLGLQEYVEIEKHRGSGKNLNILDGEIVLTKPAAADKAVVMARRIKAHDDAVKKRKVEITSQIAIVTDELSPFRIQRHGIVSKLDDAREILRKNSGITGLLFGSLIRDESAKWRQEVARLEAALAQLDAKTKPSEENLRKLKEDLKKQKTAKQKAQAANRRKHVLISRFEPSDFV